MANKGLTKFFFLALGATLLAGCTHVPHIQNPTPIVANPIWDHGRPEFCIALSGGGIRSGAVSLGVLQALHEQGLLEKADIISTVSGGGYPVYGLVAAKVKDPTLTLDSLLGDGSQHIKGTEETSFIDNIDGLMDAALAIGQGAWNLSLRLLGPTPDLVESAPLAFLYAIDIHDTFVGSGAPIGRGIALADSGAIVDELQLPYWIIQASASDGLWPPLASHKYFFKDVFELSSDWIGSEKSGYMRSFIPDLRLMDSVVASAAGIDTPRTNDNEAVIPDWAKKVGFGLGIGVSLQDGSQVFLSDGGFRDNQAVTSLLRRNCKTILALDASHDPSAGMKDWHDIVGYLRSRHWQVVDPHFAGTVGMPVLPKDAWNLPSHVFILSGTNLDQQESTVIVMKLGIAPNSVSRYPVATRKFWDQQLAEWQRLPRCEERKNKKFSKRCTFPQQATVTQNFAPVEFRAYRCLGYYMVQEVLASHVSQQLERSVTAPTPSDCMAGDVTTANL